ncbi:hypothetical protein [Waddlia chondrophila]|uniref:Uncharacterized protein n=1 Tax=Waddlia chondrophila (strain ATCC VR-1470 / WSU 86-1044) TaxID=716544 RepID=D6YS86_WADCW|nr:hypothetical protein [Waddlia chondrophila]ADI38931.1 hypothetical protein wcw_1583 [Waddlia chondrophila WSU 86-1044]
MESEPFDSILDQIAELLEVADENKKEAIKGKVDKDLMNQLDFLEMKVQFFRNVTDQALKMSGITDEELGSHIENFSDNPTTKSQKMIARADQLKKRLQVLEKQYELRFRAAKMQKKQEKSTGKKRKKKFKKLGGQGWLPL